MNLKHGMLEGIRVVDLTTVVFGPYCTQILSDLGASVIKVEAPGRGDAFRWSARSPVTPGMAPGFMALNRGKKSIALDIKADEDRATMLDLLRDADVFVVNVRGKALERLGLDYAALRDANPKLIYVHCVGFGQDGPYADLQAYDDVIQAASGTTTLLPRVDGNLRPRYLPSLIADKVAGLQAAYATIAALLHKERTGEGQHIEVPMYEAFTNFMLLEHLGGLTFDPPTAPAGYFRQLDPDRQPFPTANGFISIVAYTDDAWRVIFELLDQPQYLQESALTSAKARSKAGPQLYQAVANFTPAFRTEDLLKRCHAAQIPAQAVRDLGDLMDDPHLDAVGFFRREHHPTEGPYFQCRTGMRFSSIEEATSRHPPAIGEHTEEVASLGWGAFACDE